MSCQAGYRQTQLEHSERQNGDFPPCPRVGAGRMGFSLSDNSRSGPALGKWDSSDGDCVGDNSG